MNKIILYIATICIIGCNNTQPINIVKEQQVKEELHDELYKK